MCKNRQNLETVHYCTILSDEQWIFLLEGKSSSFRQKCLHRLMTDAVRTRTVYKIKGVDITLEVGQVAASDVELAAYLECNRKTVGKLIDSFNRLGMLTTKTNNRTSIHTLHFLTGWYIGGVLIANPHYVRPTATAKGQTYGERTPVSGSSGSEHGRSAATDDSRSKEQSTDGITAGEAVFSSSLLSSDTSKLSADRQKNSNQEPLSVSSGAEQSGNLRIMDNGDKTFGNDGSEIHTKAQDGTNGGETYPA